VNQNLIKVQQVDPQEYTDYFLNLLGATISPATFDETD
jgi:hypothetical protein